MHAKRTTTVLSKGRPQGVAQTVTAEGDRNRSYYAACCKEAANPEPLWMELSLRAEIVWKGHFSPMHRSGIDVGCFERRKSLQPRHVMSLQTPTATVKNLYMHKSIRCINRDDVTLILEVGLLILPHQFPFPGWCLIIIIGPFMHAPKT